MPDIKYEGVLIAAQDEHLAAITIEKIITQGSRLSSPPLFSKPHPSHVPLNAATPSNDRQHPD